MKITSLSALALLVAGAVASPAPSAEASDAQKLNELLQQIQSSQTEALEEQSAEIVKRGGKPSCHIGNVAIRREYGSLSKAQRLDYVNAVKCLRSKPARTPASVAAGAKSRFDDFIVTHIQQTFSIHYTGNFLAWHRWYTYTYEQALRNECGYKGYAPYWDWPKYASAPQNSPIFNGDPYSLGSNGVYTDKPGTVLGPPPGFEGYTFSLPRGLGGGCLEKGPFSDSTINLGPVGSTDEPPGPDGGFGYNPRCIKRDLGPALGLKYTNYTSVLSLLLSNKDITEFRAEFEGVPFTENIGAHGGGHFTINGDPGGDLFVSPGDPAFYVHHAQVDRMWAYWQALDPKTREKDLVGGRWNTQTWQNIPPSANTTLDDIIDLGYAGPSARIGDLGSTISGPFCYIYL